MYVMAKGLVYQIIDRNCSKTIEIENRSGAKTRRHMVMKDSSLFANIFGRAREKMPTQVGVSKILSFWQTTYHEFVFQLCGHTVETGEIGFCFKKIGRSKRILRRNLRDTFM